MKRFLFPIAALLFLSGCATKKKADLLVYNATIYTVDSSFARAEAMVIADGKILATGSKQELDKVYSATEQLDAKGKFIYPGLIDAHAHFTGYALSLQRANLVGTTSWEEVVERTVAFAKDYPKGEWIMGRGWDQNDWADHSFPDKQLLDEKFPDNPVILSRIDGHAAIVNQRAIDVAGIKPGDTLSGGEIEEMEGTLTGVLIDNAVDLVTNRIPASTHQQVKAGLQAAEANCFAVGLTTIDDCGLSGTTIDQLRLLQDSGLLKMRLYAMLSDEPASYAWADQHGMLKTDRLNVRSFKVYGDGALGSRGACLLQPYSDKPGHYGFLLSSVAHFDSVATYIAKKGWQMCTHAIGDSGNRTILSIYAKHLAGNKSLRWRIEHAQVIDPNDFHFFGDNGIIPSVQPTHATSDMYWAADRLGNERVKSAYAFKQLLEQNRWIPLGTDFPVEDISPFKTFYAAVVRKDAKGWPSNGYQMENALTREQALRGMTIWAARANFEETEKGSLEKGKWADFIILDTDLMNADPNVLLQTKVLATYLGGEKVYQHP